MKTIRFIEWVYDKEGMLERKSDLYVYVTVYHFYLENAMIWRSLLIVVNAMLVLLLVLHEPLLFVT